ncbi:MAG: hypothetical protein WCH34_18485, partial [Bacteroidota bacterium]
YTYSDGNGCVNSTSQNVTVNPTPIAPAVSSPQSPATAFVSDLVPSGVDIKWYDNAVGGNLLSSIDALSVGTTYYATQTLNGCESPRSNGVTVILTRTVNIHLILEGLWDRINNTNMMLEALDGNNNYEPKWGWGIADQIQVNLFLASDLYNPVDAQINNPIDLLTDGLATFTVPSTINGDYYIQVRNRNHLETWSADVVSFNTGSNPVEYDFTTSADKAYAFEGGDLLPQVMVAPGIYAFYVGDVNQDGIIDSGDFGLFSADNEITAYGYLPTDFNGDGFVDSSDFGLLDPRITTYTYTQRPY